MKRNNQLQIIASVITIVILIFFIYISNINKSKFSFLEVATLRVIKIYNGK